MNGENYGPILAALLCCVTPLAIFGAGVWSTLRYQQYGLTGFIPRLDMTRFWGAYHRAQADEREFWNRFRQAQKNKNRKPNEREVTYDR